MVYEFLQNLWFVIEMLWSVIKIIAVCVIVPCVPAFAAAGVAWAAVSLAVNGRVEFIEDSDAAKIARIAWVVVFWPMAIAVVMTLVQAAF